MWVLVRKGNVNHDDRGRFATGDNSGFSNAGQPGYISKDAVPQLIDHRDEKIEMDPKPTKLDIQHHAALVRHSGRAGADMRGSSHDRQVRTEKLLCEFGDCKTAPCVWCGRQLNAGSLTQDRLYTGEEGGHYRMENLVPACMPCNGTRNDTTLFPAA